MATIKNLIKRKHNHTKTRKQKGSFINCIYSNSTKEITITISTGMLDENLSDIQKAYKKSNR
jgi:hypothetical protein